MIRIAVPCIACALALPAASTKAGEDALCKPPLLDAFGGWALDVAVENDVAYIAVGVGGLMIADVSNPTDPIILGSLTLPSTAQWIAASGGYAYILDEDAMRIVDVTDPSNLIIVGAYEAIQDPQRILVRGQVAYVCDGERGLLLIDVQDPANPELLDRLDTDGSASDVVVADDGLAYIADFDKGLKIANVSDPTDIVLVDSFTYPFAIRALDRHNDHLLLATGSSGVRVLDSSFAVVAGTGPGVSDAVDVVAAGEYAYAISNWGIVKTFNIADPENLQPVSIDNLDGGSALVNVNGTVYAAAEREGLAIYTDHGAHPINPAGVVKTAFTGLADVDGSLMYVAHRGLQIFRLDGARPVELLSSIDQPRKAFGMVRSGDFIYTIEYGDVDSRLRIYNIADPVAPFETAFMYLTGEARSIAVNGTDVYITKSFPFNGVFIIDAADPAHPVQIGHSTTIEAAEAMTFSNGLLYAVHDDSLYILTPQAPHDLTLVGEVEVNIANGFIHIADQFAYLTTEPFIADGPQPSFEIVDISDPEAPIRLSGVNVGETFTANVDGDIAYLAGYQVELYDVSDPAAPERISAMAPRAGYGVLAAPFGDRTFLLTDRGFEIYNFDSCFHPDCRTDFNDDGLTNATDLAMLLSLWHPDGGGFFSEPNQTPDLNADTAINGADLAILLTNWGPCR